MNRNVMKFFRAIYMDLYYLLRNKSNKQIFFSALGGSYCDSQRCISEEIHQMAPSVKLIWECKGNADMPKYVTPVRGHWEVKKAMAQSPVWVTDASYEWKPKGVYSIAVWHGDRGFKKILHAAHKLDYIIGDTIDLFVAGSTFGENVAKEAFLYKGEILNIGTARNDKLVNYKENMDAIEEIKNRLGLSSSQKVLLFAPTFRDKQRNQQEVSVDVTKVLNILEETKEEWICLVRAHHCSSGLDLKIDERFIDVTHYQDMADLLLITDFLITDYSSCICDYILLERPCVMAQFDREEYERNSRSFNADPNEVGFLIASNQQELDNIVRNLYTYDFKEIAKVVNNYYGTNESGESAKIIAGRILKQLNIKQ